MNFKPKTPLEAAQQVLAILRGSGWRAVIAGGSARDHYLGRTPKDYDIVMLGDNHGGDIAYELQAHEFDVSVYGLVSNEYTRDEGDPPSHLDWVIKVENYGTKIDIIQQSAHPESPTEAVEAFDVSLNMAWFNDAGHVVCHPDFPMTGGVVKVLRLCDVPHKRIPYLAAKFPQYKWPEVA